MSRNTREHPHSNALDLESQRELEIYHAQARSTPLGGKAHPHQVIVPPSMRPVFVKGRRLPRALAKGGGLWWRVKAEALRLKRHRAKADPYKGLRSRVHTADASALGHE